jgi:hypothetical protein
LPKSLRLLPLPGGSCLHREAGAPRSSNHSFESQTAATVEKGETSGPAQKQKATLDAYDLGILLFDAAEGAAEGGQCAERRRRRQPEEYPPARPGCRHGGSTPAPGGDEDPELGQAAAEQRQHTPGIVVATLIDRENFEFQSPRAQMRRQPQTCRADDVFIIPKWKKH